jgi:sphinganine-1-phosphate aldolase
LRHLGEEGFERITRATQDATQQMLDAIAGIDGIDVLGDPEMCMFTLGSDEINVFEVDDEMRLRGWNMIPQFACGGSPGNLHVSVSSSNVDHVERFLADLTEVVAELRSREPVVDRDALTKAVAALEGKPLEEIFGQLAPLAGLTGDGLPERMAALNSMLDLLPAAVRDELLTVYVNMTS